jgi:hypothetical protein
MRDVPGQKVNSGGSAKIGKPIGLGKFRLILTEIFMVGCGKRAASPS